MVLRSIILTLLLLATATGENRGQEVAPRADDRPTRTETPPSMPDERGPSLRPAEVALFCAGVRSESSRGESRPAGLVILLRPACLARLGVAPAWLSGPVRPLLSACPRLHVLLCTWLH